MSDPLDRAKNDLAGLEDQIGVHDNAIRRHESEKQKAIKAADEVRTFIRLFELYSLADTRSVIEETAKTVGGVRIADRVAQIAEDQIRSVGHRIATESVCRAALLVGIPIGGKDDAAKRNNVSGILSRDGRFHGMQHHGWWLKALGPCPDDPSDNKDAGAELPVAQRQRALKAAAEFLADTACYDSPQRTPDILKHLARVGIEMPGENPQNDLKKMLSNSPLFQFYEEEGWALTDGEPAPQNTETADTQPKDESAASAEPRPTSEGTEPVRPVNPWPGGGTRKYSP